MDRQISPKSSLRSADTPFDHTVDLNINPVDVATAKATLSAAVAASNMAVAAATVSSGHKYLQPDVLPTPECKVETATRPLARFDSSGQQLWSLARGDTEELDVPVLASSNASSWQKKAEAGPLSILDAKNALHSRKSPSQVANQMPTEHTSSFIIEAKNALQAVHRQMTGESVDSDEDLEEPVLAFAPKSVVVEIGEPSSKSQTTDLLSPVELPTPSSSEYVYGDRLVTDAGRDRGSNNACLTAGGQSPGYSPTHSGSIVSVGQDGENDGDDGYEYSDALLVSGGKPLPSDSQRSNMAPDPPLRQTLDSSIAVVGRGSGDDGYEYSDSLLTGSNKHFPWDSKRNNVAPDPPPRQTLDSSSAEVGQGSTENGYVYVDPVMHGHGKRLLNEPQASGTSTAGLLTQASTDSGIYEKPVAASTDSGIYEQPVAAIDTFGRPLSASLRQSNSVHICAAKTLQRAAARRSSSRRDSAPRIPARTFNRSSSTASSSSFTSDSSTASRAEKNRTQHIECVMNHRFVVTQFNSPTFCGFCKKLIWGIFKQGWECLDCGLKLHKGGNKLNKSSRMCWLNLTEPCCGYRVTKASPSGGVEVPIPDKPLSDADEMLAAALMAPTKNVRANSIKRRAAMV